MKESLSLEAKRNIETQLLHEYSGPSQISNHLTKEKVQWKCSKCNHIWFAKIKCRRAGSGCPKCAKKESGLKARAAAAKNNPIKDLSIIQEYRGSLSITLLSRGSGDKVKWECSKCGHIWEAMVRNRCINGDGCPKCANKVKAEKQAKLAASRNPIKDPLLIKEYRGIKALSNFGAGSEHRATWECSKCGHKWITAIKTRAEGKGCTKCGKERQKVLVSEALRLKNVSHNPIIDLNLIKEYNGPRDIEKISAGSGMKVSWKCSRCNNIWEATVTNRHGNESGCPECANGGYTPFRPGYFYFIMSQDETIGKVGISNTINKRLARHKCNGLNQKVLITRFEDGHKARELERKVLSFIQSMNLLHVEERCDGWTEMFYLSAISEIISGDPIFYVRDTIVSLARGI